jgi:hypothetical protein
MESAEQWAQADDFSSDSSAALGWVLDSEVLAAEETLDVDTLDRMYAEDIIFTGVTGVVDASGSQSSAVAGTQFPDSSETPDVLY